MKTIDEFTVTETDEVINLISNKPNKRGFTINISFTKNEIEHEESINAIKEFFVREVF